MGPYKLEVQDRGYPKLADPKGKKIEHAVILKLMPRRESWCRPASQHRRARVPARDMWHSIRQASSPQLAYVVNELDSTVTAYRFDPADGALQPFQVLSAVPDAFTGNSRAAEIAVSTDGRFVYASNRGNDSIAVFAMDPTTGRLSPASWMPSGGKTPRFFALGPSDTFLFAANEDSGTLIAFRRDAANGALSATSEVVRVGSPVCILFRIA